MAKKPVKITEVVLRDAHQSLLATRMTMDEMRPILPEMDKIPYFSVECWGGATFDSCIRFLDHTADRNRKIHFFKHLKRNVNLAASAVHHDQVRQPLETAVLLDAAQKTAA